MKKEFILNGLDCANCASKIEHAIKAEDMIQEASVNFMNTTLSVKFPAEQESVVKQLIEKNVHKYEPDIMISEKDSSGHTGHDHSHGSDRNILAGLLAGTVVFAAGIILRRTISLHPYLDLAIFLAAYAILGWSVLLTAARNISRGQIFDENFLMAIATAGAFLIGDYPEGVAVMLFYQIGEFFQDLAVRRSKKSITELMDIRPDYAHLKTGSTTQKVAPDTLSIGDIIVVKPGEKIPLDGRIIEGESLLDTTALTGEPVPRKASAGDTVLSGCINQSGVLTIEVEKTFGESTVARIIDLVENAGSRKAPTENFITTFSRYYTPVVVLLASLLAVIPPLFIGGDWSEWINRGLIFLVISCPCALVISIPLGFFGGIGGASKKGILVKGSNYLEALNNLDVVVFDKTGTLTEGVFEVTGIETANGYTKEDLLELAAQSESFSNHPIALSIMNAYGAEPDRSLLSDYIEISGHGIGVRVGDLQVYAGNDKLMKQENIAYTPSDQIGTKVYLAVNHTYAGCIIISDKIKEDSAEAIHLLKRRGVRKTVMLTGDHASTADEIADTLGLDEVYAELLPDQKVARVEALDQQKRSGGKLAFIGDGINDAPVLARADVGIAMGGLGSDAAIEAADVVLMTDEPSRLADAIDIAKFTKKIVWQNIIFALGIKGVFLLMGALGFATMWEAVFADVGVSVLAILNSTRVIRRK